MQKLGTLHCQIFSLVARADLVSRVSLEWKTEERGLSNSLSIGTLRHGKVDTIHLRS